MDMDSPLAFDAKMKRIARIQTWIQIAKAGMCLSIIGLIVSFIISRTHLQYLKQLENCTAFSHEDSEGKIKERI